MTGIVLYPLLTVALYYLGSRALITQWLWSRYPPRLDAFFLCAACSGFWYGAAVAALLGLGLDVPFLGLAGGAWSTIPIVATCSIVWTPLLASALVRALADLSPGDDHADREEPGGPVLEGP